MGGTYDRYLEGESAVSKPESQLYLPPDVSFQDWHHVLPHRPASMNAPRHTGWTSMPLTASANVSMRASIKQASSCTHAWPAAALILVGVGF